MPKTFRIPSRKDSSEESTCYGKIPRTDSLSKANLLSDPDRLPFVGPFIAGSSQPITIPGGLSYLHIDSLPLTTLNTLLETLWSLISAKTDPLLLPQLAHADVIDFDVLSRNQIQIRAIWAASPHSDGWRFNITSYADSRVEVGIFKEGSGEDKDEYALEGVRVILDEHNDFEPTIFTFPHRHHVLSSVLRTNLNPANGSHPVISTIISPGSFRGLVDRTIDYETCGLHALYTLSKDVFVDKYQLAQFAQFKSGGIENVRGIWGETDLEDPAYKTPGWGSIVLLDVSNTESATTLELPLHLRYLEPVDGGGKTEVNLLPPELFWACENTVEGISVRAPADKDFDISPFGSSSRSVLHTLFPDHTVFYHLTNHHTGYPATDDGLLPLYVPVADPSQAPLVQTLTVSGILLGFTYLLIKGVKIGIKGLRWRGKGKEKAKDQ
jgi:hypothetical protein